jgi:DNA uptake protein ComE-like DNA-binding protein
VRWTRAEVLAAGAVITLGLVAFLALGHSPARPVIDATPLRLDLNAATQDELALLPDVGATTASALIRGRPYRTVEDARPVLGDTLFARVAPYLTVGPSGVAPASSIGR